MAFLFHRSRRVVLAGLLAVSAAAFGLPAQAQDYPQQIRIGSTAPGHLKFILFRHLGLLDKVFAPEGIKVDLNIFDGGSAASVALGSGAIDLAYIGNNPSLRLAASGANVKAIGLSSWVPSNETLIVTRKGSGINTLADLKGKKVAVLTGTVRHSTLAKALEAAGVDASEVQTLNLGIEASGPALVRGDVDAVVESGGSVQKLVDLGAAEILFDAAVSGKPEWAVPHLISVNGDFAAKYPELLARLLAADIQASQWADANPEEAIRIFVQETGSAETAVRKSFSEGTFHLSPEITPQAVAALQSEEAFMADAGLLRGKVDYARWIDPSYYQKAHAQLGQ